MARKRKFTVRGSARSLRRAPARIARGRHFDRYVICTFSRDVSLGGHASSIGSATCLERTRLLTGPDLWSPAGGRPRSGKDPALKADDGVRLPFAVGRASHPPMMRSAGGVDDGRAVAGGVSAIVWRETRGASTMRGGPNSHSGGRSGGSTSCAGGRFGFRDGGVTGRSRRSCGMGPQSGIPSPGISPGNHDKKPGME